MTSSILMSIREKLGPSGSYDVFDPQLIDYINMALGRLNQIGIGPKARFYITGDEEKWTDFIPEGSIEEVRTYVALQVRILFDPPSNGSVLQAYNDRIREIEWELNALFDHSVEGGSSNV